MSLGAEIKAGLSGLARLWNAGRVNALGANLTLTSGTLAATGGGGGNWTAAAVTTLGAGLSNTGGTIAADWHGGTVAAIGTHLVNNSGTLDLEASQSLRTVPFSFSGKPGNSQRMVATLTQAGTLVANGGAAAGFVGTNPTATNNLVLSTINAGTITARGTIAIATTGSITFPSFAAVPLPAGGSLQLVNQASADTTLADFCLSLQFQVT